MNGFKQYLKRLRLTSLQARLPAVVAGLVLILTLIYTSLGMRTLADFGRLAQDVSDQAVLAQGRDSLSKTNTAYANANSETLSRTAAAGQLLAAAATALYRNPNAYERGRIWDSRMAARRIGDGRLVGGQPDSFQIYVPAKTEQTIVLYDELNLLVYLDPLLAEVLRDNRDILAAYLIWAEPNLTFYRSSSPIDLGAVLPTNYDPQSDIFYTVADQDHNPSRATTWTPPYQDPAGQGVLISAITPIYIDGRFLGVVGLDLSLAQITNAIRDPALSEQGGYTLLIGNDGELIGYSSADLPGLLEIAPPAGITDTLSIYLPQAGPTAAGFYQAVVANASTYSLGGQLYYLTSRRQAGTGWYVAGLLSEKQLLTATAATGHAIPRLQSDLLQQNLLLGTLLALLVGLLFLRLAHLELLPLGRLREAVRAIGSGDLGRRLPNGGPDEVAGLAAEFNRMAARLQARNTQADALYETALEVSSLDDLNTILRGVAERARNVLDADMAAIFVREADGELACRAAPGRLQTQLTKLRLPEGHGLAGRVVATGLPIASGPGYSREFLTTVEHREIFAGEDLEALLGAPLCIGTRCFGALLIGNRTPRVFHHADMELLTAFANQAAVAAENARLAAVEQEVNTRRQSLYLETIAALADAMEARDNYTHDHADQMVERAEALARVLGVPEEEIATIKMAALLHDVGKIGIPDAILRKPGPLTDEEYKVMQRHPEIGARIVGRVESLRPVVPLVLHHQECWDGTGYPAGLRGEAIPRGSRIIAVVDAFGAMTEDRVYRPSLGAEHAIAELLRGAGSHFDPLAVDAFVRHWQAAT